MTFQEILAQVTTWLQREQRVSYSALKRQLALDDAYLKDLKDELIYAKKLAMDEEGRVLVWTGVVASAPLPAVAGRAQTPLAYTPPYLSTKILASRADLAGERKQVTVLFADLKGSMELIQSLDPEDARKLLDPALHAMMDAVHRFEGTVNQALALADELGMRPLQAHCHHGLGRLYGQTGRGAPARAALATAIELSRAMDMTFWLPQVEAALAQVE